MKVYEKTWGAEPTIKLNSTKMKRVIPKEKYPEFNEAIVLLAKSGMTPYSILKAFTCRKCGHKPDKRNAYKTIKKYFNLYGD